MRKLVAIMTTLLVSVCMLSGCGSAETNSNAVSETETKVEATNETNKEAEETVEQKPVILAVSFGTSYNDSRDITIGAVENALATANPDYEVRRAFTSQIIIDVLKERDQLEIDNVEQALERLIADEVKTLVVQPTHVMSGYEYDDLMASVDHYKDQFDSVLVGSPLLTSDADYEKVVSVLVEETASYNEEETAIVLMGHGTAHAANSTYAKLQETFKAAGYNNYFVGTVEATPSLEDVIALVKEGGYKKVVLEPLMLVAGDHANNDMAGDEEDSWKSAFKAEGFEVETVIRGLGEFAGIQEIYVAHCKDAKDFAEVYSSQAKEATSESTVADGVYNIAVSSSSSMFKIEQATLTVKEGKMSAVLTLSGKGYEKLFLGTAEEAANASEDAFAFYMENGDAGYKYEIEVEALDKEINCAAYSFKKQTWYDRVLVFDSATLELQ